MLNLFSIILLLFSATSYAVINGASVTVAGTTLCNNGTIERTVAGTMTTTCGAGWSVGALGTAEPTLIFSEDFDSQADWTSGLAENDKGGYPDGAGPDREQFATTHNIPTGWYGVRQDPAWAPSRGHPTKHEAIEILSANSDKARGGTGKSYVSYRDAVEQTVSWTSDSILTQYFPSGYDELYVEFYIRFDDNWTRTTVSGKPAALSKLFRISSWSGEGEIYGFGGGRENGPIFFWDHLIDSYDLRSSIAMRAGPHGDNYGFTAADNIDTPVPFVLGGSGDLSMGYTGNHNGAEPNALTNGNSATLTDKVNGGYLDNDRYTYETHDQVFGATSAWTKIAFYVKMNSAVDVGDGELRQWIDDTPVLDIRDIPWMKASATEDTTAKWNTVSIGGNDYFKQYLDSEQREEWYSIDDIVMRSGVPAELQ